MWSLIRKALRILFIILFLTTAIGKLLDNRGFAAVLSTYELLPEFLLLGVGLLVSVSELFIGLSLVFNYQIEKIAGGILAVHFGYLMLAIVSLYRELKIPNCGCFGVFWGRPLGVSTVVEDLILVVASVVFFVAIRKS